MEGISRATYFWFLACVALSLGLLTSCGQADTQLRGGDDEVEGRMVAVPARWNTESAANSGSLKRFADLIFIGEVLAIAGEREGLRLPSAEGENVVRGVARADGESLVPITLFDVAVEEAWAGGLASGAIVTVEQAGGEVTLSGGTSATLILEGDEPLIVGERYLFFLGSPEKSNGHLMTVPFMRLKVMSNGQLVPLQQWQHLESLRELSGKTRSGAKSVLGLE